MQLPLSACQQFGKFAYQDEQKGIDAIIAIQYFIEEYHDDGNESSNELDSKAVMIERNQKGIIVAAKSVKFLPNMQINLKALIQDTLSHLQEAVNLSTIVIGGALTTDSWIMKTGAVLYLIKFALGLKRVALKAEQAGVLIALHHLARGELKLEISLAELQAKVQHNYHLKLNAEELDDILEDLVDLYCVTRQGNMISLLEKVIINDAAF